MVKKRKPADATAHAFCRILVSWLGTQVVDLYHISMVLLQKLHDISSAVAVESFRAFCWEATGDDSIRDVSHVKIKLVHLQPCLIS